MRQTLCLFPIFLFVLTCVQSTETDIACKRKGKSLASLNMARESIAIAKELYPNCSDHHKNSSVLGCEAREKSFGYLDVALNLVSYALQNYPTCDGIPEDEKPEPEIRNKTLKHEHPMDCSQVLENGYSTSGIYSIWLKRGDSTKTRAEVFCDMETSGGGWTVIQRRGHFPVQEDFYRDWATYKKGFGNLTKEFWIGNENIFLLTNQSPYSIRFDLEDANGIKGYAVYRTFKIESEAANYRLQISGYSGNVVDSLTGTHNGKRFSTKDRRNEYGCGSQDCSDIYRGGWWYGEGGGYCCYGANLNGLYEKGSDQKGITWIKWRDYKALKAVEMKLKRV